MVIVDESESEAAVLEIIKMHVAAAYESERIKELLPGSSPSPTLVRQRLHMHNERCNYN